jgi:ABC-type transporter Mla MlaB component
MSLRRPYGLTTVRASDSDAATDGTEFWVLDPAADPDGVPGICERLAERLRRRRVALVVCDVGAIVEPDGAVLAALARLRLAARRRGCRMELRRVQARLRELILFAGLDEVLPVHRGYGVQPVGEAEQREQPGGVEEVADPLDPAG